MAKNRVRRLRGRRAEPAREAGPGGGVGMGLREMHDDPVVFALKDRPTWCLGLIAIVCVLLARPL